MVVDFWKIVIVLCVQESGDVMFVVCGLGVNGVFVDVIINGGKLVIEVVLIMSVVGVIMVMLVFVMVVGLDFGDKVFMFIFMVGINVVIWKVVSIGIINIMLFSVFMKNNFVVFGI